MKCTKWQKWTEPKYWIRLLNFARNPLHSLSTIHATQLKLTETQRHLSVQFVWLVHSRRRNRNDSSVPSSSVLTTARVQQQKKTKLDQRSTIWLHLLVHKLFVIFCIITWINAAILLKITVGLSFTFMCVNLIQRWKVINGCSISVADSDVQKPAMQWQVDMGIEPNLNPHFSKLTKTAWNLAYENKKWCRMQSRLKTYCQTFIKPT